MLCIELPLQNWRGPLFRNWPSVENLCKACKSQSVVAETQRMVAISMVPLRMKWHNLTWAGGIRLSKLKNLKPPPHRSLYFSAAKISNSIWKWHLKKKQKQFLLKSAYLILGLETMRWTTDRKTGMGIQYGSQTLPNLSEYFDEHAEVSGFHHPSRQLGMGSRQ